MDGSSLVMMESQERHIGQWSGPLAWELGPHGVGCRYCLLGLLAGAGWAVRKGLTRRAPRTTWGHGGAWPSMERPTAWRRKPASRRRRHLFSVGFSGCERSPCGLATFVARTPRPIVVLDALRVRPLRTVAHEPAHQAGRQAGGFNDQCHESQGRCAPPGPAPPDRLASMGCWAWRSETCLRGRPGWLRG